MRAWAPHSPARHASTKAASSISASTCINTVTSSIAPTISAPPFTMLGRMQRSQQGHRPIVGTADNGTGGKGVEEQLVRKADPISARRQQISVTESLEKSRCYAPSFGKPVKFPNRKSEERDALAQIARYARQDFDAISCVRSETLARVRVEDCVATSLNSNCLADLPDNSRLKPASDTVQQRKRRVVQRPSCGSFRNRQFDAGVGLQYLKFGNGKKVPTVEGQLRRNDNTGIIPARCGCHTARQPNSNLQSIRYTRPPKAKSGARDGDTLRATPSPTACCRAVPPRRSPCREGFRDSSYLAKNRQPAVLN